MQQQMITLVPVPRQVAWGQEWLTLSESLTVAVTGEQQALLPTVGRFVRFARQRLGLPVSVTASSVGLSDGAYLLVVPNSPGIAHPQGCRLTIDPERMVLESSTAVGTAYGLATLRQVLDGAGRRLPTG